MYVKPLIYVIVNRITKIVLYVAYCAINAIKYYSDKYVIKKTRILYLHCVIFGQ